MGELTTIDATETPFHITPTGLDVERPPSLSEWQLFGESLLRMVEVMPWIAGDWSLMGDQFGEGYANAIELTGYEYDTISKYRWVANHVPRWVRRDPSQIKWSYHKHLAHLPPERQDFYLSLIEKQRVGEDLPETAISVPLLSSTNVFYAFVQANEKIAALQLPEQVALDWEDPKDARRDADIVAAKAKFNVPKGALSASENRPDPAPESGADLLPPCPLCGGRLAENHCRDCRAGFTDMAWVLSDLIKDVRALLDTGELGMKIRDIVLREFDFKKEHSNDKAQQASP